MSLAAFLRSYNTQAGNQGWITPSLLGDSRCSGEELSSLPAEEPDSAALA